MLILLVALLQLPSPADRPISVGLSEESCVGEVEVANLGAFRAVGTCSVTPTEHTLRITAMNAFESVQRLSSFTLGFCGPDIVDVYFPAGWEASVRLEARASVRFRASGAGAEVESGTALEGFVIHLKPGWRRSSLTMTGWESSGNGTGASHDCPQR